MAREEKTSKNEEAVQPVILDIAAEWAREQAESEGKTVVGFEDEVPAGMLAEAPKIILDASDGKMFAEVEERMKEEPPEEKIVSVIEIPAKVVGLVTGTFDILHQGHMSLIHWAQKRCDELLIAIECDKRVRKSKGKKRPIYGQEQRKARLERAMGDGTKVEILPENFDEEGVRMEWLRERGVRLLFTSRDDPHLENKQILMMLVGGRVEFVPVQVQVSSTGLLESKRPPKFLIFDSDIEVIEAFKEKYGKNQDDLRVSELWS